MSNVILALPAECWRWVPGYEDLYQVSTRGRVRSVDRWVDGKAGAKQFIKGQIMKPFRNHQGYLVLNLSRNDKLRHFRVNRLVAMAWLDNPEGKPQVNHINECKTDNDVYNLEWCSRKYNINYGTGIERRAASQSKSVQALDPETGVVVLEFPSISEAGRKGFEFKNISACCLGKRKTHKGYIWRYKQE